MLTRGDITQLEKTRQRVQELERKLEDGERTFPDGRLAEACQAVDASILQVLILAKVHGLGPDVLTAQKDAA